MKLEHILQAAYRQENIYRELSQQVHRFLNNGCTINPNTCAGSESGCPYRIDLVTPTHSREDGGLYRVALLESYQIHEHEHYNTLTLTVGAKDPTYAYEKSLWNDDFHTKVINTWMNIGEDRDGEQRYLPADMLPIYTRAKRYEDVREARAADPAAYPRDTLLKMAPELADCKFTADFDMLKLCTLHQLRLGLDVNEVEYILKYTAESAPSSPYRLKAVDTILSGLHHIDDKDAADITNIVNSAYGVKDTIALFWQCDTIICDHIIDGLAEAFFETEL